MSNNPTPSRRRGSSAIPGVTIRAYKSADGREAWRVVLSVGGRANRERPSEVVYGDHEKAVARALELRAGLRRTGPGERARQSVADFLLKEWLPAKRKLRPTTREGYENIIRTTIASMPLGSILLDDVEPLDVQLWMNALRDKGRPGARRPMAEARLLRCFAVLRAGMKQAVRWRRRIYDPTTGVEPPSPPSPHVPTPNREELEQVLDLFHGHLLEPAVGLAAGGGLRLGEALGLRWPNVDLETATILIVETLRAVKGGTVTLPPKSERSRREVNLPSWVVDVPREARQQQTDDGRNVVSGHVVVNASGVAYHPQEASRQYREAMRKAGLGRYTFHALRHAHASLGLDEGVDLSIMSRRLGHSTLWITDRLYYHPGSSKDREAAAKFDKLITRRRARRA